MNPCKTNHKETSSNGICKNCGYNTRHLTNKELKTSKKKVAKKMVKIPEYSPWKESYNKMIKSADKIIKH